MNRRGLLSKIVPLGLFAGMLGVGVAADKKYEAARAHRATRWTVRWVKEVWCEGDLYSPHGGIPAWLKYRERVVHANGRVVSVSQRAAKFSKLTAERSFDSFDDAVAWRDALVKGEAFAGEQWHVCSVELRSDDP